MNFNEQEEQVTAFITPETQSPLLCGRCYSPDLSYDAQIIPGDAEGVDYILEFVVHCNSCGYTHILRLKGASDV